MEAGVNVAPMERSVLPLPMYCNGLHDFRAAELRIVKQELLLKTKVERQRTDQFNLTHLPTQTHMHRLTLTHTH